PPLETSTEPVPTTSAINESSLEPETPPGSAAETFLKLVDCQPEPADLDIESPHEPVDADFDSAPMLDEPRRDRPEMRIAAVATVIGLIVFAIIAVYTFVSNAARRPAPALTQSEKAVAAHVSEPIFVATPQAAQDYQPGDANAPKTDASKPDTPKPDTPKPDTP